MAEVGLDRLRGNEEALGDLAVGHPLGGHAGDPMLARGEPHFRNGWDRVLVLAQQATQVIGTEIGITQDAGEGAFAKLPVQRHDECESVPGLLEPDRSGSQGSV